MTHTLPRLPYGTYGNSLHGRLAFHLQRLNIIKMTGSEITQDLFTSLRRGHISLALKDLQYFATIFQVDATEFTRSLTPLELDTLHFYQASRFHCQTVSDNLKKISESKLGNQRRLAQAAGTSVPYMNSLIHQKHSCYLKYQQALGISEEFNLEGGAWFAFDGCQSPLPSLHRTALSSADLPKLSPRHESRQEGRPRLLERA